MKTTARTAGALQKPQGLGNVDSAPMRVALAQLDARLGDVDANEERARAVLADAGAAGADLVVFPELYLSGYALRGVEGTARRPEAVGAIATTPAFLIGFHEEGADEQTHSSAAYVEAGMATHVQRKLYLVGYPPFCEDALFAPGSGLRAFDTRLGRFAVLVCNDAWQPFLPPIAVHGGAQMLFMPSCSSTAVADAKDTWRELTRVTARLLECYVVFVNRVGDEAGLSFWGGSHVVDPLGVVVAEAPRLEEALVLAEIELERVATRRRDLPLLGEPRFDLLVGELTRLRNERRIDCNSGSRVV